MNDIDDIVSNRSTRINSTTIEDIDHLSVRDLNKDEPKPDTTLSRDLLDRIHNIDKRVKNGIRLPMTSGKNIASVRIIPDTSYRSDASARSYRPTTSDTRKPDRTMSNSERSYIWRMKFQRLNARNPRISIPDTTDPDALERLYTEAIKTDHYCSTTPTWLIYMGLGYTGFQFILHKLGISLPSDFVITQLTVMSHYKDILKSLGDPGGPSLGSTWPPWIKLLSVMCIHTLMFIIIYKVTDNASSAYNAQKFICNTGFMGGSSQGEEAAADIAITNLGGMFGGLGGMFKNMLGPFMGMMGGGDSVADINLEDPPEPVSNRFDSNRPTPFD